MIQEQFNLQQIIQELKKENEHLKKQIPPITKCLNHFQSLEESEIIELEMENKNLKQMLNEESKMSNVKYELLEYKHKNLKQKAKLLKKKLLDIQNRRNYEITTLKNELQYFIADDKRGGTVFFLNYFKHCNDDVKILKDRFSKIDNGIWKCIDMENIKNVDDFNAFLEVNVNEDEMVIFFFFGFGNSDCIFFLDDDDDDYCNEMKARMENFNDNENYNVDDDNDDDDDDNDYDYDDVDSDDDDNYDDNNNNNNNGLVDDNDNGYYLSYDNINKEFKKRLIKRDNPEIIVFANVIMFNDYKIEIKKTPSSLLPCFKDNNNNNNNDKDYYIFIAEMIPPYFEKSAKRGVMISYLVRIDIWPESFRSMARKLKKDLTELSLCRQLNSFKQLPKYCYWNAPKYRDIYFPSLCY